MPSLQKNKGFTLVELIIVLTILGILAAILIPTFSGVISHAKGLIDETNLKRLNRDTNIYSIANNIFSGDIFSGLSTDDERMQILVDNGYMDKPFIALQEDKYFHWSVDEQIWILSGGLSPFGSTFAEIFPGIIATIQKYYQDNGSYGRSWGEYRYTDIGLDPMDWKEPINHIYYVPSGSNLLIKPEKNYTFVVESITGATLRLPAKLNWNIIYSDIDKTWYYHYIDSANIIDIDTLQVVDD